MPIYWNGTPPTDAQKTMLAEWLAERPPNVRAVAERFDPWQVYRLTTTGQAVQFMGCDVGARNCGDTAVDVDRVTARVYAQHPISGPISGVEVFGIDPGEIEPWPDGVPFDPAGELGDMKVELICEHPGYNGVATIPDEPT